ncbi:MAG TPA: M23 family metallopeptidase [Sphingorhabdus sp.]|jgi:hypothetical protein|nr:M23 family metallopeptidase [Sphingorhabdus sp.]
MHHVERENELLMRVGILGAALMASGTAMPVSAASSEAPVRQAFDMSFPYVPSFVLVGNDKLIAYELHLTNFASSPLTLIQIRVGHDISGAKLLQLNGETLASALGHVGPGPYDKLVVPPGRRVVIYLETPVGDHPVPKTLQHCVEYTVAQPGSTARGSVEGSVIVDTRPLPILSPPLRGKHWTAVYDPKLERGHRRVVYAVGGKARIPGRFAIDWMANGQSGNGLGADVLAVADGVVASVRDGVPQPVAGSPRPEVGIADATGNYISIDIGGGRFAFYEHLMPGLLIKPGQRVRRGQVIGRVGSTGQAWRPHLHFHLADADSPLAAEGLPYLLEGAQIEGAYPSIAAFEVGGPWQSAAAPSSKAAFPAPNVVVSFDCKDEPYNERKPSC